MKVLFAALLALAAGAAAAQDYGLSPQQVCDDQLAECKDGCTLNFGTTLEKRDRLYKCLNRCQATRDACLEHYLATRQVDTHTPGHDGPDPIKAPPDPGPKVHYPRSEQSSDPKPRAGDPAPLGRSATRGSELGDAPDTDPEPYPSADDMRAARAADGGAARAQAPKQTSPQSAPAAATPPPPAKKKDLSEWNPDDLK